MPVYAAIDLKSFYASVECVERGLDPLTARLVVADESRTAKTICLAVSPALKRFGLPGRCRLFEVEEKARDVLAHTGRPLDYVIAPPRMRLYMDYSTHIYEIYLRRIAPEDIHVYSVDEVFIDLTPYLGLYGETPHGLTRSLIRAVQDETGITATAGIGSNLYLAKVAMDIVAKHVEADADGVRIAELDEHAYREQLWSHRPLTDFWRIGPATARRLERMGLRTMGDICRLSLSHEDLLYREFGVEAELIIDHAWGAEPCTLADIRRYRPQRNSVSAGQVLPEPYDFAGGRLIVREMTDQLALELTRRGLVTDCVSLNAGYDTSAAGQYAGPLETDRYGRAAPPMAHGTEPVDDGLGGRRFTASSRELGEAMLRLYDRVVDPSLPLRRFYVAFDPVRPADAPGSGQLSLLADPEEDARRTRETSVQQALVSLRGRHGKNAVFRGMSLQAGATALDRNRYIGGHRAGIEENEHA